MAQHLTVQAIALVYQGGIANVFEVNPHGDHNSDYDKSKRSRLMQSDFRTCEAYALGMVRAGCECSPFHCNEAGDISGSNWSRDIEDAPFADKFRPVFGGPWTSTAR